MRAESVVWYHLQILNQDMPPSLFDHRKEATWHW